MGMAHACASQSMTIATAYDSLGPIGVEHSLCQTDATAMFIDPNLIKTATEPLSKAKSVKTIIYSDKCLFEYGNAIEDFKAARPDLRVISIAELREMGAQNPVEYVSPKPDDMFCVMYTSGSAGTPKGVVMTHKALLSGG